MTEQKDRELYRWLRLIREFESRVSALDKQGKLMGGVYSGKGQEWTDFSKDPNAVKLVAGLSERDRYLPCIFGVNVLEDGFILWTTDRDSDFKHLFDIYDREFRLIGRSSEYNYVCQNFAVVRGNRIYLPEVGSDDMEFKKKIGRLSVFEVPISLSVYDIKTLTKS